MVVLKAAASVGAIALVFHERALIASSFEAATGVKWIWLVVAIQLELLSLASFAGIQARLLRAGSARVGFLPVMKTVYAGSAVSAVVPIAGSQLSAAYAFRRFKRFGVDGTVAAWSLVVSGVISSLASASLLVAGAILSGNVVAIAAGSATGLIGAGAVLLAMIAIRRPVVLTALVGPVGYVLRKVAGLIGRPVEDPESVLRDTAARVVSLRLPVAGWAVVWAAALLNWLADIGALAASIASVGAGVPWRGLLLAYGVGTAAATVGLIPGGLGVVEAALALTLMGAGVHHPVALAAVLVYRLISFWMVNSIGWLAYVRSGREVRAPGREARREAGRRTATPSRLGRSHGPGDVDLDLPGEVTNLQTRQRPGPVRQLREKKIA